MSAADCKKIYIEYWHLLAQLGFEIFIDLKDISGKNFFLVRIIWFFDEDSILRSAPN